MKRRHVSRKDNSWRAAKGVRMRWIRPPNEDAPEKYPLQGFDNIPVALKAANARTKGGK